MGDPPVDVAGVAHVEVESSPVVRLVEEVVRHARAHAEGDTGRQGDRERLRVNGEEEEQVVGDGEGILEPEHRRRRPAAHLLQDGGHAPLQRLVEAVIGEGEGGGARVAGAVAGLIFGQERVSLGVVEEVGGL